MFKQCDVVEFLGHFSGSSQSCVYPVETTWCLQWKIPLENPWKCHFQDSKFQNVPRCLGPQELVPLV